MNVVSSPQSVSSARDSTANAPDPKEIAELLRIRGYQMPTYDIISRDSTPDVSTDAQHWIDRVEALCDPIRYLNNTFSHEEWRQSDIFDDRYWRIEADHWESCYTNNTKVHQSWQGGVFKNQHAQHDLCFFRDVSDFNWLLTYTRFTERTAPPSAQDESPKLVFEITYHRHRAKYWAELCRKRGYAHVREDIRALYYWQTEFACLHRQLLRLEKRTLFTETKSLQKARVSKTKTARVSSKGDFRIHRTRTGVRKSTRVVNKSIDVRRSARLRNLA